MPNTESNIEIILTMLLYSVGNETTLRPIPLQTSHLHPTC